MGEADLLRRRLARERQARLEAERVAEEALAKLYDANQALDAKVGERTASLQEALELAEQSERAKHAFLAGVAHRTGSPLHAIQGFIDLVARELQGGALRDAATTAGEETRRLSRAFEALLELSEAVSAPLSVTPTAVEVGRWVDRLLSRWLPESMAAGRVLDLRLDVDPQVQLEVDPGRLAQLVDALLDNALQHGAGLVEVWLALEEGERLSVTVVDEGVGVPPELVDTAFDAFVSAHGPRGFGVGLTLAHALATAMGGTVSHVEAATRTTFRATVPAPLIAGPAGTGAADVRAGVEQGSAEEGQPVAVDVAVLRTLHHEIGSPTVLGRMVEVFLDTLPGQLADLQGDDEEVRRRTAHMLAATTGQLGMGDLAALARRVEHGGGPEALATLVQGLQGCPGLLVAAMRTATGGAG